MRLAILLLGVALAAGCSGRTASGGGSAKPVPHADLTISVWQAGPGSPVRSSRLRCPGHTPKCGHLARLSGPFAPVPPDVACTEIYGGPQTAEVRGTYRGRRVAARFNRTNGCEIARWDEHAFLFPTG